MKKILYFASALVLGLSLASCESELDIPQKSVLSYDQYYAEAGPEQARQLIASVYRTYYTSVCSIEHNILLDVLSDTISSEAAELPTTPIISAMPETIL